jgi:hypothetical protein
LLFNYRTSSKSNIAPWPKLNCWQVIQSSLCFGRMINRPIYLLLFYNTFVTILFKILFIKRKHFGI